jgi:hypothetical protein
MKCWSLVNLSSLVNYLRVRPEPTLIEHLSWAPVYGRLEALRSNVRSGANVIKLFTAVSYKFP